MLAPLTMEDTAAMIRFRCERAGSKLKFPPDAVETVYTLTGGVPREVLKVCGVSYLLALSNELDVVSPALVEAAYEQVLTQ